MKNTQPSHGFFVALLLAFTLVAHTSSVAQSRFSAQTLRIGVENYLRDNLGDNDQFEIAQQIEDQTFPENYVVARCDADKSFLKGNTKVSIVFSKNDKFLKRIYVPVSVKLQREVPVVARAMQRGEVLQAADVELKMMDITYISDEPVTEFVGMRLTQNCAKAQILTRSMLSGSSDIQRGDQVSIVLQYGNVQVRTMGTALDNAGIGQTVRVRKENSSLVMTGTLSKDKSVLIVSPTSQPSTTAR